ncbi:GNAT family N-acetyltransferase [Cytobacillus sp. Sa5YUA1]|uniref:GNAT family N-acetyltransferase n=1 Tax=Cytobacillus stercorigallinarum TaxID=2762240 RepID=A0ABR8QRY6_9BACI|nr:GNAT family N-acetyltransferase [Cytobacillus stercorigallinarum]MBD7938263.1 GNAT family N-acetyltransferase [Cytobacillus stercorigallinarum]
MLKLKLVNEDKKRYLDLLLLADEQENMIDQYLERGDLYIFEDKQKLIGVCVVTEEKEDIYEIKNLAVVPHLKRKGYGKKMIQLVEDIYKGRARMLQVGTGDSPLTIPFYQTCGFHISHQIDDFFVKYYDQPIYEGGKQLIHMVILQKQL